MAGLVWPSRLPKSANDTDAQFQGCTLMGLSKRLSQGSITALIGKSGNYGQTKWGMHFHSYPKFQKLEKPKSRWFPGNRLFQIVRFPRFGLSINKKSENKIYDSSCFKLEQRGVSRIKSNCFKRSLTFPRTLEVIPMKSVQFFGKCAF